MHLGRWESGHQALVNIRRIRLALDVYLLAIGELSVRRALFCLVPLLFAADCVSSTCSCLPETAQEPWVAVTSTGDSATLQLRHDIGSVVLSGTGTLLRVNEPLVAPRSLSIVGEWDAATGAPRRLEVTGWLSTPIVWTSTTMRADNLYGVFRLPPGVAVGDTLGLFVRRNVGL